MIATSTHAIVMRIRVRVTCETCPRPSSSGRDTGPGVEAGVRRAPKADPGAGGGRSELLAIRFRASATAIFMSAGLCIVVVVSRSGRGGFELGGRGAGGRDEGLRSVGGGRVLAALSLSLGARSS